MAVVSQRRVPNDQPDRGVGILIAVFVGHENLGRFHGIFRQPMVPVEMADGPDHLFVTVHARVLSREQILVHVFEVHAPRIAGLFQQGLDLHLNAAFQILIAAVFEILYLLFELRTPPSSRTCLSHCPKTRPHIPEYSFFMSLYFFPVSPLYTASTKSSVV